MTDEDIIIVLLYTSLKKNLENKTENGIKIKYDRFSIFELKLVKKNSPQQMSKNYITVLNVRKNEQGLSVSFPYLEKRI